MRPIPYVTAKQWRRQLDKEFARWEFRLRQRTLALAASIQIIFAVFTEHALFFALAALLIQTGSIEALRFRKTGTIHQTKRSIWRGSTPHDARHRHLLGGWRPLQSTSKRGRRMTDPFGYFVYVRGLRGPAPQKWWEREMRVEGKPKETIGKPVPLTEAEWKLSLDELVKRYPVVEAVS